MTWWMEGALMLRWPTGDWALVGRWFGHIPGGRFVHRPISSSEPVRGELAIGWTAHYAIGIAYGVANIPFARWLSAEPAALVPALLFSWALLVFPWFVMQPALGAGFFASRAPQPGLRRLVTVSMHTAFGIGLYAGARLLEAI